MPKKNLMLILWLLAKTLHSQTTVNLIGLGKDEVMKRTTEMHNVLDSEKQLSEYKFLTFNNPEGTIGYAYYIDKNNICVAQNVLAKYSERAAIEEFIKSVEKDLQKIEENKWLEKRKGQVYEWTYKEDGSLLILHIMPAKL